MANRVDTSTVRIFMKPIPVRMHRQESLKLRGLSLGDMSYLDELIGQELPAREFVVQFIHHQLISPKHEPEIIRAWKDKTLARVAWTWASHRESLESDADRGKDPLSEFQATVAKYVHESKEQVLKSINRFSNITMPKLEIPNIGELSRLMDRATVQYAGQSAQIMKRIAEESSSVAYLGRISQDISLIGTAQNKAIEEAVRAASNVGEIVERQLREISEITRLAQQSVVRIPWEEIERASRIPYAIGFDLRTSFLDFSHLYNDLATSLKDSVQALIAYSPQISRLPSVEYLYNASLYETLIIEQGRDIAEEREEYRSELVVETEDALYVLLNRVDVNLVRLWEGAQHSIASENPDRVRHAAVSMRELLTHVLHMLAPDDSIRSWSTEKGHYDDKGRPTRRARLLYICRRINHDPLTKFVQKDVEATIEFIDLFQRGTHQLVLPFTEDQLRAMKARMEGLLRFLLELASPM